MRYIPSFSGAVQDRFFELATSREASPTLDVSQTFAKSIQSRYKQADK
jgi:hypothetical protein